MNKEMKGKIVFIGIVTILIMIIIKFTVYAISGLTYNALLPLFQGLDEIFEYIIDLIFSIVGFLVLALTYIIKPSKTTTKWEDEEGKTKTKSTNKYLIGILAGLVLIFFPPISQLIMLGFYSTDNFYTIIIILAAIEGIGWVLSGYGLGVKVIKRCYHCNKKIEKGHEIKCKTCGNVFCSEDCYDAHMLYTHDKCAICGKGFGRGASYETCPQCKKLKFCSVNCLREHNKLKH
ncbi:MAG: hypothetical protein EU551_01370 [Promethearchaeota archaeon]|nr:MAG: hypothetical protein EU551_01370 [Candidatus Lokiarchaeota archaeon]